LKKLADLHQSGPLTDEEFAAKRSAIVDRLSTKVCKARYIL
jgi:hypothetical protein